MNGLSSAFRRRKPECLTAVLLAVMFLVGVTIGAFISGGTSEGEIEAFRSTVGYSAEHSAENPFETVKASFFSVSAVGLLIWLFGFLAVLPKILLSSTVISYKGAVVGYTVGMLLRTYALKGLCIAALSILPQYVFFLPFVFYLGSRAVTFEMTKGNKKSLKGYCKLLLPLAAVCAFSAFADAFISGRLLKLFSRLL